MKKYLRLWILLGPFFCQVNCQAEVSFSSKKGHFCQSSGSSVKAEKKQIRFSFNGLFPQEGFALAKEQHSVFNELSHRLISFISLVNQYFFYAVRASYIGIPP